jgi:hypothetical protein
MPLVGPGLGGLSYFLVAASWASPGSDPGCDPLRHALQRVRNPMTDRNSNLTARLRAGRSQRQAPWRTVLTPTPSSRAMASCPLPAARAVRIASSTAGATCGRPSRLPLALA